MKTGYLTQEEAQAIACSCDKIIEVVERSRNHRL